jgi:F-type H+-transporting ATPase subunit b
MITLDSSVIPAIIIFLVLIVALNKMLFKPLMKVQAERESRTTGLMKQTQDSLTHHLGLFDAYQATIKNARLEGYRRQEQLRTEAMKKRAEVLAQSRAAAERMILESRDSIDAQVDTEKQLLTLDAQEIAASIASTILGRSAAESNRH